MALNKTDKFLDSLRIHIKELRADRGITQLELAKLGGNQHQSAIARLEAGTSPNVGIKILFEMSQGLSVPLWKIIQVVEDSQLDEVDGDLWGDVCHEVEILAKSKKK